MSMWDQRPPGQLQGYRGTSLQPTEIDLPWIDQLAQHVLLTVQAVQRLHMALDGKFTR